MGQVIYCLEITEWIDQAIEPGLNFSDFENWNESGYILLWNHGMNIDTGHRTGPKFVIFWKLEWVRLYTACKSLNWIDQAIEPSINSSYFENWNGSGYILLEVTELIYQAIEPGLTSSYFENWNESGYILPGTITEWIDQDIEPGINSSYFENWNWVRLYIA